MTLYRLMAYARIDYTMVVVGNDVSAVVDWCRGQ